MEIDAEEQWNAVCDEMNVDQLDWVGIADCDVEDFQMSANLPPIPDCDIMRPGQIFAQPNVIIHI